MKIVFLVHRTNTYRYFAPIIKEGLVRGFEIECWHDYSQKNMGAKWYNFPYLENIPDFGSEYNKLIVKKTYDSKQDLAKLLLERRDIGFIISIRLPIFHLPDPQIINLCTFKWVGLMSTLDVFPDFVKIKKEQATHTKKIIFFSFGRAWAQILRDYLLKFKQENLFILDRGNITWEVAGNPEFDLFDKIDPQQVREKYKIPKDKDVLLYLPFCYGKRSKSAWEIAFAGILLDTFAGEDGKFIHDRKRPFLESVVYKLLCLKRIISDPVALKSFLKRHNEERVFMAVREFCDKNNLYLVAKPRLKHPVIEAVKERSDLLIWDNEHQTPAIFKELLSLTKVTVTFFSYAVLTSVFGKSFNLNVTMPKEFFADQIHRFWFSAEAPSFFQFSGACESWDIEKIINKLGKTSLGELSVDPVARKNYVEKYIGFDDYSSSVRFFDALEKHKARNLAMQNYGK